MPITNQTTFIELTSRYHENPNKFSFFVGAGLSQPLFPSWASVLRKLVSQAAECGLPFDQQELEKYINNGENYLDIAEVCISALGTNRYRDIMEEIFDKDFNLSDIPLGYKILFEINPKIILTTNYDRIPDIAGLGRYRVGTNRNAAETQRALASDKNVIFKIHGDITDNSSLVLKASDYQSIIHNNEATRNLLSSLLSTRTLIFVGFSLSDPHIGSILENIKFANNNIPISHYVLLNEQSAFKISSFEKKYGVKVISYTPQNESHSEVIDFLRALNTTISDIKEVEPDNKKIIIKDVPELLVHTSSCLSEIYPDGAFSIFHQNEVLNISISPLGETKSEIQKELLSLLKIFNFDCNLIKTIKINAFAQTRPSPNVNDNQQAFLTSEIDFNVAKNYSSKTITTSSVWKELSFFAPQSISNPLEKQERVSFPLHPGIIEA